MTLRANHSPGTAQVRRILAAHREADRTGRPVEEVLGQAAEHAAEQERVGPSRRAVLGAGLGAAAVAATGLMRQPAAAAPATAPRVVIVGAGLAGLRAAHWLYKVKGITASLYEGNTRAGGRCYSLRNYFDDGAVVEHGGAFINTDHNATRNLASTLGLQLDVVSGGNYRGWKDKYWIDGVDYPYDAANADWGQVYQAMRGALTSAPYCQTFDSHTAAGVALDNMTVDEWLAANVPGGLSSRFAKLMQSNVMSEYGLEPDQQSALNLVYLLGWNSQNSLDPVNGADEKYLVRGGNDLLVSAMEAQLAPGSLKYGHTLVALKRKSSGELQCTFRTGQSYVDVTADKVILALPFTTLRDCDLSQAGFSALKLRTIAEQGLGSNGKIHLQLSSRPWVQQGYGGTAYTNKSGFQCAWDDTAGRETTSGVVNFFPSGTQVTSGWSGAAFGPAPATQVNAMLAQMEPIFPGVTAAYTGKSYRDFWYGNPWSKGAYTAQRPGQYTQLFGQGAVPEGNVHFAGEHTSVEYYGFLEGAVRTGERAAKAVLV